MLTDEAIQRDQPLADELVARVRRAQQEMARQGLSALIVYGNTKVIGSFRYLSGHLLDRCGWVSWGPTRQEVMIFDGAAVLVPQLGDPVLLLEPGQMFDQPQYLADVRGGGLGGGAGGLTPTGVAQVLEEFGARERVGIETWDRFPAPLYLGLVDLLPGTEFTQSTIVEELRLMKSKYELGLLEQAGQIGDLGHAAFIDALRNSEQVSELEAIRRAEATMREADLLYEEPSVSSPSKISSGSAVGDYLLHVPSPDKFIGNGDVVCWDICMRFRGYAIDVSRTRMLGTPSTEIKRAYDTTLRMSEALIQAARPGTPASTLGDLAREVAGNDGFALWEDFVGHGLGLDTHERPDMGVEEMSLVENMVLTIEPRIALDGWLLGNEDMIVVTPDGGRPLTHFPKDTLELES